MYGKKEDASIIALKAESGKGKSSFFRSTVEKAVLTAKQSGAKVYIDGNYHVLLFTSTLTKIRENEVLAVKISQRMAEIFKEHNRKFKDKIRFGIGVNRGEIIGEKKHDEFNFTTVGTAISRAKRIAQSMEGEALLSDSIRRAVATQIKTEKVKDKDEWKITKITDRTKHEDFLHKFTHRKK